MYLITILMIIKPPPQPRPTTSQKLKIPLSWKTKIKLPSSRRPRTTSRLSIKRKPRRPTNLPAKGSKTILLKPTFQLYKNGNFYTVDLSAIEYTSVEVRNSQAKISGPIGPLVPNTDLEVSFLKENKQWCVYGYKTT